MSNLRTLLPPAVPVPLVAGRACRGPVLIFDLDGTILAVNSFPRWARRLVLGRFSHLPLSERAWVAARSAVALAASRLKITSHQRLRWRLQHLWRAAIAGDGSASETQFQHELLHHVRPALRPLLTAVATGRVDAVLATAAAEDYAVGLGRALGFTHILATPATKEPPAAVLPGEVKRQAVTRFLAVRGWQQRPCVLFTDHPDDLPLMRMCGTVYWFGTAQARRACERLAAGCAIHSPPDGEWAALLASSHSG